MDSASRIEQFRETARAFPCPTCFAPIGEPCVGSQGAVRISNHQSRAELVRPMRTPRKQMGRVEVVGDPKTSGYVVYAIRDKATGRFGYVGQTGNFASRSKAHTRAAIRGSLSRRRTRWMHEIVSSGGTLEIVLVAHCTSEAESLQAETEWVSRLTREGHELLNKWVIHQEAIKLAKRAAQEPATDQS